MGEIAILDPGAQLGKNIDRRVREANVESDFLPFSTPAERLMGHKGIIIAGGEKSVYGADAPKYDPSIFRLGIPILGICYGMHLLNQVAGGTVTKQEHRQDGACDIEIISDSHLFAGLPTRQRVLMTHGDSIDQVADGFTVTARSEGLVAAMQDSKRKWYGIQFHPESDITTHGRTMLKNFIYGIADCIGGYTIENRLEKAEKEIRVQVGDGKACVLESGGVDSAVTKALMIRALGADRVTSIYVNNGFMRHKESEKVRESSRKVGGDVQVVHAEEDFYAATTQLRGTTTKPLNKTIDPEEKRVIIGDTFIAIAKREMKRLGLDPETAYLAQGTLRPDLIESASKLASAEAGTIKTHHNDSPVAREFRETGHLVEPLVDYHKDEVRGLGRLLGLPEEQVMRQPFPGPGLAIRIICADKPQVPENVGEMNAQLKEFEGNGVYATVLPIQTVGIQGDGRSYSALVGLSGTRDWDTLFKIARDIPKRIHGVNRVAYVFGGPVQAPVTDVTPTLLRPEVIYQLQLADDIVNQELMRHNLITKLSQVPVISFPVNFGNPGQRSIAIRTFITNDFMTGVPAVPGTEYLPEEALDTMVSRILKEVPNIARVAFDLTSKPPGTTEWE